MRPYSASGPGVWKGALLAGCTLILSAFLSSCSVGSTSADGGPAQTATALITFCDDGVPDCPPVTTFSLSQMRDLVVKVDWFGVAPGNHTQEVRVMLPEGTALQVSDTGFLIGPESDSSFSSLQSVRMAGSWQAQRQETGTWSVDVLLDGRTVKSETVEMTP